jgi:hypothetical protein
MDFLNFFLLSLQERMDKVNDVTILNFHWNDVLILLFIEIAELKSVVVDNERRTLYLLSADSSIEVKQYVLYSI